MSIILSFDLGTTGNRVIAFDHNGSILAKSYNEFPQHFPQPAWVEHNPEDIWSTTQEALKDILHLIDHRRITAIGITNQRETTMIWDRRSGQPIYNGIVWQCRRTTDYCNSIKSSSSIIKTKTGLFLDPYFSATKIKWILDNVEGARQLAHAGHLAFGTVDTWLLWKLTDGSVHATDPSNASRTMLYNIETLNWDDDLLELFDIPRKILPEVMPSDALFGKVSSAYIPSAPAIRGILGDQQAALFAHQSLDKPTLKNTYGTGLFMVAHTPKSRPHSDTLLSTIAWHCNGRVDYALEGSVFIGGSAIQWLRDGLNIINNASDSESLATSINSNEGVYFVPALSGLGSPHWDPDARGMIIGLTRGTTRAHIARATLESLAYQTADVYHAIQRALPHTTFTNLSVDGGAIDNNFLMQFQSDILQLEITIPSIIDITAFGVAGVASISSGVWSLSEFLSMKTQNKVYSPQHDLNILSKNIDAWQEAVKRSKGWNHYAH